jgi:hypothetical protein
MNRNVSFEARRAGSALLLCVALPLVAQVPNPKKEAATPKPKTTPATSAALTSADVESFLDGFMDPQIQEKDIGGAVVVIVKDVTSYITLTSKLGETMMLQADSGRF